MLTSDQQIETEMCIAELLSQSVWNIGFVRAPAGFAVQALSVGLQAYDIGRRANDDSETHGIVNIILTDQSRLRYALLVIMTAVLKT